MNSTNSIRFSATSHVGRVRKINEDSLISLPELGVWLISDGMGGHAAGDFASQTVTEAVATIPAGLSPRALMSSVRSAINRAHEAIQNAAAENGGNTIGATVVALIVTEGHFVSFWAGDSRLYRLRNGEIELLTTDHSIVANLVEAGNLTWDEAEHHPQSNAITRAVGVGDDFGVEKIRGDIIANDRFLLCSDGLNKYADFQTIEGILKSQPIETVVDTLLNLALDRGGADNISIIVIDIP